MSLWGRDRNEENGASHILPTKNIGNTKVISLLFSVNHLLLLSEKRKKNHITHFKVRNTVRSELLFLPLAWIIKSLLCAFNQS